MVLSLNPAITGDAPVYASNGDVVTAVESLKTAIGDATDVADDDTVIGQLKQVVVNTSV